MQNFEESERDLKLIIANQKNELKEQDETFNEAGNPDYDHFTRIEKSIKIQLEQISKSLRTSLSEEVERNNKKIEEKLNHVVALNQSYASTLRNGDGNEAAVQTASACVDLRTIIKEA